MKNSKKTLIIIIAAVTALVIGLIFGIVYLTSDGDETSTTEMTGTVNEETTECAHIYQNNIVEPTEDAQGYVSHVCAKCAHTYKDNFYDATGTKGLKYVYLSSKDVVSVAGMGEADSDSIVIPEVNGGKKVTVIGEEAFSKCEDLKSVKILGKLERIESLAFAGCKSLTDIYYAGTKAEWKAITKGNKWDVDTSNYTVHCSDGDIAK